MLRRGAILLLLVLAATPGFGCSVINLVLDPDALVSNRVYCSPGERFCAVVRTYEIADFTSVRSGKLFGLEDHYVPAPLDEPVDEMEAEDDEVAEPEPPPEPIPEFVPEPEPEPEPEDPPKNVIVALYDASRHLVAEIPLPPDRADEPLLVADSGRFLVSVKSPIGICGSWDDMPDPMIVIFRSDGTRTGAWKVHDVVTAWDRERMHFESLDFALRHEPGYGEVLVVGIPSPNGKIERRIDLTTATLLDPVTNLYPAPTATIAPMTAADGARPLEPAPADCAAAFGDPALVRLDSDAFLQRAISTPVPEYPIIAVKARIAGAVRVDAVVSEWGEVVCARSSMLPFGLADAARNAVRQWRFRPFFADGRRTAFAGEVLFRFQQ